MGFLQDFEKDLAAKGLPELVKYTDFTNMAITYEHLLGMALVKMGFPNRSLPLDDVHLATAYGEVMAEYSKWKPCVRTINVTITGTRQILPSDRYVIKVDLDFFQGGNLDLFGQNEFTLYTRLNAPLNLSTYVVLQEWVRSSTYLFAPDDWYRVARETVDIGGGVTRELNVFYASNAYAGRNAMITYTRSWDSQDLKFIPQHDRIWILKYLTEKLRFIEGEIYSAVGTIPSATTTFTLDGEAIKTSAQTEIDKLLTELKNAGRTAIPFYA